MKKYLLVAGLILVSAQARAAITLNVSTTAIVSNGTAATSISTSIPSGDMITLMCSGNAVSLSSPTNTASVVFSTVIISLVGGGNAGIFVGYAGSAITNKTFSCQWPAGSGGLLTLQSWTGTAGSASNPLQGIGASAAANGTTGTLQNVSYVSTFANSQGIGTGDDHSNGETVTAGTGNTLIRSYGTDVFSSHTSWSTNITGTTAGVGTTVTISASGVTNNTPSSDQVAAELLPASAPIVTTLPPTNVTFSSATGNGSDTNQGAAITDHGVCINTTGSPTLSDTCFSAGSTVGTFNVGVTGLSVCIKYYLAAYSTNSIGTTYGNTVPFVTSCNSGIFIRPGTGNASLTPGSGIMGVTP